MSKKYPHSITFPFGKFYTKKEAKEIMDELQNLISDYQRRIENLQKENKELKDNAYKDKELQDMREDVKFWKEAAIRGFPIYENEQNELDKQFHEHLPEIKITDKRKFVKYPKHMIIKYEFYPTEIGTMKKAVCRCGKEFTFSEI